MCSSDLVGELEILELTLDLYFKIGKETSVVYEDAQDGYDYKKGRFCLTTFKLTGKDKDLVIQKHIEGKFETSYLNYKINFIGMPFAISKIYVDNEQITFDKKTVNLEKCLLIDKSFTSLHIIGE